MFAICVSMCSLPLSLSMLFVAADRRYSGVDLHSHTHSFSLSVSPLPWLSFFPLKRCCDIFVVIIEIQDSIVFGCSHFIKVALIRKYETFLRRHDTQHNDIRHNDTQHNDTQHNDTQHNDTHSIMTLSIMTLSITIKKCNTQHNGTQYVMLSVIYAKSRKWAHYTVSFCIMSYCWVSLCWLLWRPFYGRS
jgi:hypothetical protein